MAIFNEFVEENGDPGISFYDLGRAVLTWGVMQNGDKVPTVAAAAAVFNTSTENIHVAITRTAWISWRGPRNDPTKQIIEFDGE